MRQHRDSVWPGEGQGTSSLAEGGLPHQAVSWGVPQSRAAPSPPMACVVWGFGYVHPRAVPSHVHSSRREDACSTLRAALGSTRGGNSRDQSAQSQAPASLPSELFIDGCSVLGAPEARGYFWALGQAPTPGSNTLVAGQTLCVCDLNNVPCPTQGRGHAWLFVLPCAPAVRGQLLRSNS